MRKTATFTDQDQELIKKILTFQKEHKLKSFIDAVRQLCETTLQVKDIAKKLK